MVLEVIFLIAHGWTVRVVGTRERIHDHIESQDVAIELARMKANDLIHDGWATVEVRIKTKWLKRVRDSRTYGRDPKGRG